MIVDKGPEPDTDDDRQHESHKPGDKAGHGMSSVVGLAAVRPSSSDNSKDARNDAENAGDWKEDDEDREHERYHADHESGRPGAASSAP